MLDNQTDSDFWQDKLKQLQTKQDDRLDIISSCLNNYEERYRTTFPRNV